MVSSYPTKRAWSELIAGRIDTMASLFEGLPCVLETTYPTTRRLLKHSHQSSTCMHSLRNRIKAARPKREWSSPDQAPRGEHAVYVHRQDKQRQRSSQKAYVNGPSMTQKPEPSPSDYECDAGGWLKRNKLFRRGGRLQRIR